MYIDPLIDSDWRNSCLWHYKWLLPNMVLCPSSNCTHSRREAPRIGGGHLLSHGQCFRVCRLARSTLILFGVCLWVQWVHAGRDSHTYCLVSVCGYIQVGPHQTRLSHLLFGVCLWVHSGGSTPDETLTLIVWCLSVGTFRWVHTRRDSHTLFGVCLWVLWTLTHIVWCLSVGTFRWVHAGRDSHTYCLVLSVGTFRWVHAGRDSHTYCLVSVCGYIQVGPRWTRLSHLLFGVCLWVHSGGSTLDETLTLIVWCLSVGTFRWVHAGRDSHTYCLVSVCGYIQVGPRWTRLSHLLFGVCLWVHSGGSTLDETLTLIVWCLSVGTVGPRWTRLSHLLFGVCLWVHSGGSTLDETLTLIVWCLSVGTFRWVHTRRDSHTYCLVSVCGYIQVGPRWTRLSHLLFGVCGSGVARVSSARGPMLGSPPPPFGKSCIRPWGKNRQGKKK